MPARWLRLTGETEGMKDGSDAVADWAHPQRAGQRLRGGQAGYRCTTAEEWASAIRSMRVWWWVADGTDESAARLERVLTTDPAPA